MLSITISTLWFLIFLALGNVLQFLHSNVYILVPCFYLFLWICKLWYHRPKMKSLEIKDFILTFLFVGFALCLYQVLRYEIETVFFTYVYLSAFLSIELFANSIRFKSLI